MHFRTVYITLLLAALAAGCDVMPTGVRGSRQMGILEWRIHPSLQVRAQARLETASELARAVIAAPDTVEAGAFFTATVTTIGADYCWQPADATLQLDGSTAVVTPYDSVLSYPDTGCADARRELLHPVRLRFTRPGEAVLRVRGRKVVGQDLDGGEEVVVEKRIQVL
ncbi:MAG: hypothetical protein JO040_01970 [Gemmatimonadetes bacterium]|nr:hypothetical protein [Gemmatimonadota bacterium]